MVAQNFRFLSVACEERIREPPIDEMVESVR